MDLAICDEAAPVSSPSDAATATPVCCPFRPLLCCIRRRVFGCPSLQMSQSPRTCQNRHSSHRPTSCHWAVSMHSSPTPRAVVVKQIRGETRTQVVPEQEWSQEDRLTLVAHRLQQIGDQLEADLRSGRLRSVPRGHVLSGVTTARILQAMGGDPDFGRAMLRLLHLLALLYLVSTGGSGHNSSWPDSVY